MLAVVALVGAAACGGGSSAKQTKQTQASATSAPAPATTTTTRPPRKLHWPLTGLPTTDAAATTRPALTVKIDNNTAAHPQVGLDLADVVYEEVVECDLTRLAAVFQSHVPPTVGPIRSVRRTDTLLTQPLHGIFVFSGGADYAIASIEHAPVVRIDQNAAGNAMFRDSSGGRFMPHNLFGNGPALYAKAPQAEGPPRAVFAYGSIGAAPSAPATHADVGFKNGYSVTWDYSPATHMWKRGIFGRPDILANGGGQIAVRNVVVLFVNYVAGVGACNSEGAYADLQSSGPLMVLRDGRVIHGSWKYNSHATRQDLFDANGTPLNLDPGSTWVEMPKPTYTVTAS
jgi:hypothetical protein